MEVSKASEVGWLQMGVPSDLSFFYKDGIRWTGVFLPLLGGFEGPGWGFTGDEVGISAFLVYLFLSLFFDHGKWLQMAECTDLPGVIHWIWSDCCRQLRSFCRSDRFLTFWRIPYGFCLSALTFSESVCCYFHCHFYHQRCCPLLVDCRWISFSSVFMIVTNDDEYRISASLMASTILKHQRSHPCFSVSCQSHKFDHLKCHGWPIQMYEVWILNCFEHTDEPPGKPSDTNLDRHLKRAIVKMKAVTRCAFGPTICIDSWQLCLWLRLGYSTYFMSSFMPQPHFWRVDS